MTESELVALPATEQRKLLAARSVSARELLDAHLARVAAVNPAVNAVVALDADVARARAAAVDDAVAGGAEPGRLAGLVTAHKDLTETADFPTTYGSAVFAGFRPPADSLLVGRMRAAGAVAIGKTNTPEFGAGSHTFNPVYGVTRNPYDVTRSAGGSSGGAAAALACGMVAVADGSDMGGSLRNPAAWCNVVGLRPTPRLVPTLTAANPWVPLATEGPMGRTVEDVRLLLSVLAAPDRRDPLSFPLAVPDRLEPPSRPLRVAWSRDVAGVPVEAAQLAVLDRFRAAVADVGWDVADREPPVAGADECFHTLRAWLFATGPAGQLGERLAGVKATVRDEVARGQALGAQELADALGELGRLRRRAVELFERVDLLAAPVAQLAPFPVEWEYPTSIDGVEQPLYTSWMAACCRVTVLGTPALSLPAGFDDAGRPVGVQLIAAPGNDIELLRAAAVLEEATGHGSRRPDIAVLAAAGPAGFGPGSNIPAGAA